jgi:hypothetical protein
MNGYKNLTDLGIQSISAKYFEERKGKSKAQEKPAIVFIGAQPGAGKSTAAKMVRRELDKEGGYIHVDADRMRERIPTHDCKPTSQETQLDAGRLANALRILALKNRRNIIEEGTLRIPGIMANVVEMAHNLGYTAKLVAVATHREESLLGIYERFERQHSNPALNPRFVSEDYHEGALIGFTNNLALDAKLFDKVRVVSRDGQTLFDSAAQENRYANAYEALMKGRELTPERIDALAKGWERVKEMSEKRRAPPDYLEQIGKHVKQVCELEKKVKAGITFPEGNDFAQERTASQHALNKNQAQMYVATKEREEENPAFPERSGEQVRVVAKECVEPEQRRECERKPKQSP